uniref:SWIM-type domain-containing protein n=2 Tax=Leersia perrieri TaxID=77586 RepID=A0A0D9VYW7_9ORYZ
MRSPIQIAMARWDEILTLPVQNPPTPEFSAADIMWSMVEGWKDSMDRLALIPFSRVNDFVRGESNNKECPTRFHVEARRRRPPTMNCKPKVDGILEYWCSFGPDDYRTGGTVRPSRNSSTQRKTPAGRPHTKRGCICHFIVKRLIAEPSVALVIYNHNKHVDKKAKPCHGPMDDMAIGTKAMFAPYISDGLRLQIMSLLCVGIPVETIMQRHTEMVKKQGGPSNRDDLLTHRYVRRLERKIRRSVYELDDDDAVSINIWVESHEDHVFLYEDFSDTDTFVVGIQTDWQLQQMIQYGNRSLLASDSKFGTHKLKYPVHSLLVFDQQKNAIPVAWIITPNFAHGETYRWMGALYDRVRTKDPTWQLGGFIIDDPLADVRTIREVFQCAVLISPWRIRHAWHKNLMNKCPDNEKRPMMAKRLGEVICNICRGNGGMELFEGFLEDFVDCAGAWVNMLKTTPLASTEVASAIERYHHLLKLRLLNEANEKVYQRADWLVHKLGTKVHSYYWLDGYSGKDNFSRYWRSEWKSGSNPWQQGLQIPDSDVVVEGNCARVVCQKNKERSHVILNPGSDLVLCDCSWSRKGNICKHAIKSTKVSRQRGLAPPSLALFQYYQALANVVHCPPSDTVISDHAVAVAVFVRTQLDSLLDETNGNSPNSSTFKDPQVNEPRESDVQEANIKNDVCASQSPDESGDEDHYVFKKRKSREASDEEGGAMQITQPSETESSQATDRQEPLDRQENPACKKY